MTTEQIDSHSIVSRDPAASNTERMADKAHDPVIVLNHIIDPAYAPYCMRCADLVRMVVIEPFYWECRRCGGSHDERQVLEEGHDLYYMQVTGHSGNSLLWWRKGRHGYTCDIRQAHVFTREEAFGQHRCRPTEDFPWRKDYIDAHLQHHVHCEAVKAKEGRAV